MKKQIQIILSVCVVLLFALSVNVSADFTDVQQDAYYAEAVQWAYEHGVTTGKTAELFGPLDTVTRGEAVTFLWRAMGRPEPADMSNPFVDVKETDFFYQPVLWAAERGITVGTSADTFTPGQTCSRAQIITFLYRANREPGKTGSGEWYADAVAWANGLGLLDGTAEPFSPGADCPRADVVTYLYRNKLAKDAAYDAYYKDAVSMISSYTTQEDIQGFVEAGDGADPYTLARLLVGLDGALPDLNAYNVVASVTDPDGNVILQFANAEDAKRCAEYLQGLESVRYAEPDGLMQAAAAEAGSGGEHLSWGVSVTGADAYAADLLEKGISGSVTVAVTDTGIDAEHPFLVGRIIPGYDFVADDDTPEDIHGHGTHVSGTIVDCTPGLDIKIMPVKVLGDNGWGTWTQVGLGVRYAVDHGADVISMSLGGGHSDFTEECIEYAVSQNVTVVVCAQNYNTDTRNVCPAHIEDCITVAAVDNALTKASFSNYGDAVDICAPGVDILSSLPGGKYAAWSGTSMATPHVSAAAAMLLLETPSMTPAQVSDALRATAVDLGEAGWDAYYGAGLLKLQPLGAYHTLTFDANGGMGYMEPQTVYTGVQNVIRQNTFSRSIRVFTAWNTAPDGSGIAYADQGTIALEGDLTLYAQWEYDSSAIYAVLYDDGELSFQYGEEPKSARRVISVYQVSSEGYFPSSRYNRTLSPWLNEYESIRSVSFADAVAPRSTAGWFFGCHNIERMNLSGLDTANVIDMSYMFADCDSLSSLDLSTLDTGNVTNMSSMFARCAGLTSLDLSPLNTGEVTDMSNLFAGCSSLTVLDLSPLDTGGVTNMSGMIAGCSGLTYLDLSPLDTDSVTDMSNLFAYCSSLTTLDLSPLDTGSVTNVSSMFSGCSNLTTLDLSPLDTGDVTNMSSMFARCTGLTYLDLSPLDTSSVTDMSGMFTECSGLTSLDLSPLNTANVTNVRAMFAGCSGLTMLDLSPLNTVKVTSMSSMFFGCSGLTVLDLTPLNTVNVSDMGAMFAGCSGLTLLDLSPLDTVKVTSMRSMFSGCSGLKSLDLSPIDTANVTDMSYMFAYCSDLIALDLSPLNTANVTYMSSMFNGCSGLTSLDLTPLDTSNVTDMSYLFADCSGLTSLDLSPLNTANVKYMSFMFRYCSSLTSLDLTPINSSNVTDMSCMFADCSSLTSLDLSPLNTANVTSMDHMFYYCSGLTSLDLSHLNLSNVTHMAGMFALCDHLDTIYVAEGFLPVEETYYEFLFTGEMYENHAGMFAYCASLIGGAGTVYDPEHTGWEYARIDGGPDNPGYFTAKNS